MNKKERVLAAIRQKPVDYVPCGFSLHFPQSQSYDEEGVRAHLRFFEESDTDIIKIMNENLFPCFGAMTDADSYSALCKGFSIGSAFMQDQIAFTREILDRAEGDAFSVGTLHGITASAIHPLEKMGISYQEARERQVAYLRDNPHKMLSAMARITDTLSELAVKYVGAGLDGVYYAALGGEYRYFTDEEFHAWIEPFDKQVLSAIREAGGYVFLHICKDRLNMERYASYAEYADVVNWGVHAAPFSLEDGRRLFKGKTVMGGLPDRHGVLVDGSEEEIAAAVEGIIGSYGRTGLIVGADCTLATEQDMAKLSAAVRACRR